MLLCNGGRYRFRLFYGLCSPYYSPWPFAATMLAATPFPHGSGANLAVAGFVVGTLSDQLLPSGHRS